MNNDSSYAVFTAFEQLLINWYFTSTRLLFKCERSYRRNFQTSRMCCSKWHVNLFNCWLNLRRVEVHSTEMKKKKKIQPLRVLSIITWLDILWNLIKSRKKYTIIPWGYIYNNNTYWLVNNNNNYQRVNKQANQILPVFQLDLVHTVNFNYL